MGGRPRSRPDRVGPHTVLRDVTPPHPHAKGHAPWHPAAALIWVRGTSFCSQQHPWGSKGLLCSAVLALTLWSYEELSPPEQTLCLYATLHGTRACMQLVLCSAPRPLLLQAGVGPGRKAKARRTPSSFLGSGEGVWISAQVNGAGGKGKPPPHPLIPSYCPQELQRP